MTRESDYTDSNFHSADCWDRLEAGPDGAVCKGECKYRRVPQEQARTVSATDSGPYRPTETSRLTSRVPAESVCPRCGQKVSGTHGRPEFPYLICAEGTDEVSMRRREDEARELGRESPLGSLHADKAEIRRLKAEQDALRAKVDKAIDLLVGDGSTRGLAETQAALNDAWTVLAYD